MTYTNLSQPSCPRFSAVVLNWRRPGNLPRIIDDLLCQPFVDDVHVWNNAEAPPRLDDAGGRVQVWSAGANLFTAGRWIAARFCCRHDQVLTQDDDYRVRNWPEIVARFVKRDRPSQIVAAMPAGHAKQYAWKGSLPHEVLVGWGGAFSAELAWAAFRRYANHHGIDELLLRKADRIVSRLLMTRHDIMAADVDWLDGVRGEMALYRQPNHGELNKAAAAKVAEVLDAE